MPIYIDQGWVGRQPTRGGGGSDRLFKTEISYWGEYLIRFCSMRIMEYTYMHMYSAHSGFCILLHFPEKIFCIMTIGFWCYNLIQNYQFPPSVAVYTLETLSCILPKRTPNIDSTTYFGKWKMEIDFIWFYNYTLLFILKRKRQAVTGFKYVVSDSLQAN